MKKEKGRGGLMDAEGVVTLLLSMPQIGRVNIKKRQNTTEKGEGEACGHP